MAALRSGCLLFLTTLPLWAAGPEPAKLEASPAEAVTADREPSEVLSALIEQLRPLQINGPHIDFADVMLDAQVTSRRWRRRRKSPFRSSWDSAESSSKKNRKPDKGTASGGL